MDAAFLERLVHLRWLQIIRQLKGVNGAMHFSKNKAPTPYKFVITIGKGAEKSTISYLLNGSKDIEAIEAEYEYIHNDLKKRGHG